MDRNALEQEALALLNRGNLEGALKAFLNMLRLDPKDRRVRQRVGELQLKLGRPVEAEKMLREVAESLVREGQGRAAVAIYKQILTFKADDPTLHYDLADCYAASGYPNDARLHFDTAARMYATLSKHIDAARALRRVVDLVPTELVLKLKIAEHLDAGKDPAAAVATLREVIEDYRRRGRPDEVGRIAEVALKLAPDDAGLMVDAGAARIEAGDHARALSFLQGANLVRPDDARTLQLLSRAQEDAEQTTDALDSLRALARVLGAAGDVAGELDALRRAARLSPADSELRNRLIGVERQMTRQQRRLTQLQLAQASNEDELRTQVRAEVFARYGKFDRAIAVLRNAADTLPLLATHAEVLALSGDVDAAVRMIDAIAPKAGKERDAVFDRIAVLRGLPEAEDDSDAPTPAPTPAEVRPPSPLARADALAEAGDIPGALLAYRQALELAPANETILGRIAALRNHARAPAEPAPVEAAPELDPEPTLEPVTEIDDDDEDPFAMLEDGTLTEISPDDLAGTGEPDPFAEADVAPITDENALEEARSLIAIGMNDDALTLLRGDKRLEASVLTAQALRAKGDAAGALEVLRDATNDAAETDEGYAEALFELSGLYTATGKHRAAVRLLEELEDLAPGFRPKDVQARLTGLARLLK